LLTRPAVDGKQKRFMLGVVNAKWWVLCNVKQDRTVRRKRRVVVLLGGLGWRHQQVLRDVPAHVLGPVRRVHLALLVHDVDGLIRGGDEHVDVPLRWRQQGPVGCAVGCVLAV